MGHAYAQRRDTPCIPQIGIDLAEIVETGQRLAERAQRNAVSTRLYRLLVILANSGCVEIENGHGVSLKSVPTNKVGMFAGCRRVAEAHQINSSGPMRGISCRQSLHIVKRCTGAAADYVVH